MSETTDHPGRRDPCRSCGARTKAKSGVCPFCAPSRAKRPERACKGCGKRTTSKTQECRACEPTYMKQGPVGYEHAVYAERPGRWVTIKGIQHWVAREVA